MENIGNKITETRRSKGINQKELASLIGVSQPSLIKFEKGETDIIPLGVAKKLAKNLGVSFNELFEIEDSISVSIGGKNEELEKLKKEIEVLKKTIEDKEKIIEFQEKDKKLFKEAVIRSITSYWETIVTDIDKLIRTTESETEKELLERRKDHAERNKEFQLQNFIHIGFLSQKDLFDYYKALQEHYEAVVKVSGYNNTKNTDDSSSL